MKLFEMVFNFFFRHRWSESWGVLVSGCGALVSYTAGAERLMKSKACL